MSRSQKKTQCKKVGSGTEAGSRTHSGKSRRNMALARKGGKEFHHQAISKAEEDAHSTTSNMAQVSTTSRHTQRFEGAVFYRQLSQVAMSSRAQDTGTSSEMSPVKNEFRIAFNELPGPGPEYGARRTWQIEALTLLTKALFLESRVFDLQSLSDAIAPMPDDGPAINSYFYQNYRRLVEEGRILTSQTGSAGGGQTPFAFDLKRDAPFSARGSLRSVLQQYRDSNASASAKRVALSAVRVLLKLDPHSSTLMVLKAAADVPFPALHRLPERFASEATLATNLSKKTIANFTSALRAIISFGLRSDLFPLYFPPRRPLDAWTDVVEAAFPLAATGRTDREVLKARCGLFALFEEARDVLHVAKPTELSVEHVLEAVRGMSAPHRLSDSTKVAGLKKVFGRATGQWDHPVIRVVVEGLEALRPVAAVPYLQALGPTRSAQCTLEGFFEVLTAHQMDGSWEQFFAWYYEYSSLSWRDLDARSTDFPPRPPVRELGWDTFRQRLSTARAYLGAARELYPSTYRELTPADVFGEQYRPLTQFLLLRWKQAAKQPHSVSHQASAGLCQLVIGGGMIARALFDLEVHKRKANGDTRSATTKESARAFVDRERVNAERTDKERAQLEAYNYSRVVGLNLLDERRQSDTGSGSNTVKDLRRSIRETPFWKFQKAQDELLARVKRDILEGSGLSRDGIALAVATLVHGILLSGGVRRSEVCHLREGVQTHLLAGSRQVELRSVDRKNNKPHPFALRERWLPEWFLQHYLYSVRPLLSADVTSEIASSFLVFSPSAKRPFGCPEENSDGSGRDTVMLRNSKKQVATLWRKHVGLAFVALGYDVPVGKQRFTMHIVRNVGGHAVFLTKGLEAAAHFLGDSVSTVEGVYAALIGEFVDTSLLE